MAPQLEDGYTRLANELLEAFAAHEFSSRELRILIVLARETYGWRRDRIQISQTKLSTFSGIDRSHTRRTLKRLEAAHVVTCYSQPSFGNAGVYGIQKHWTRWTVKVTGRKPGQWLEDETRGDSSNQEEAESAPSRLNRPQGAESAPLGQNSLSGGEIGGVREAEVGFEYGFERDSHLGQNGPLWAESAPVGQNGPSHVGQNGPSHVGRIGPPHASFEPYEEGVSGGPKERSKKDQRKKIPPTPQDRSEDTLQRGVAILEQLAPGGLTSYRKKLFEFLELPDADDQKIAALETAARDVRQALRSPRHQIRTPALMAIHQARTELVRLRDVATSSADYEDDGPPEATEEQLRW